MDITLAASDVNWVAVAVAPFAGFVIGPIWYGPLFKKAWMASSGVTADAAKAANKGKTYGTVFVLNLIAASGLALLAGPHSTWLSGLVTGLLVGWTCIATSMGVNSLFEFRPINLFAINAGFQILVFSAMGTIVGAWH